MLNSQETQELSAIPSSENRKGLVIPRHAPEGAYPADSDEDNNETAHMGGIERYIGKPFYDIGKVFYLLVQLNRLSLEQESLRIAYVIVCENLGWITKYTIKRMMNPIHIDDDLVV